MNPMGRVTITFYPNDRKQSNTTEQIPIYLRIRKERLKTEARTDWSVSPNERALWNKTMQRIDLKDCKANDYLNKIEEKFNALRIFKSEEFDDYDLQTIKNLILGKNPDQYSMLSSLRITRSKARNLLYESKLRQSVNLDDELIALLKEPILIKNDDKVCLEVDNPLLIDHIKHELRDLKFITDGSFSPDLVKLSPQAYKTLLNKKFNRISKKELKKALVACGAENEITVKSLLTGVLKKVGKKVADDAGNQAGEFIGDYLGDLFSSNLNKATEFIKDNLGKDKEFKEE